MIHGRITISPTATRVEMRQVEAWPAATLLETEDVVNCTNGSLLIPTQSASELVIPATNRNQVSN
jgi:hypothetical protein